MSKYSGHFFMAKNFLKIIKAQYNGLKIEKTQSPEIYYTIIDLTLENGEIIPYVVARKNKNDLLTFLNTLPGEIIGARYDKLNNIISIDLFGSNLVTCSNILNYSFDRREGSGTITKAYQ